MRGDQRLLDQMRELEITRHFTKHAAGSVLMKTGDTVVLCTATVEARVPFFLRGSGSGWLTAEYAMLPSSTIERKRRSASRGQQEGRSVEIQRLIGRSLRHALDLKALGERTIWIDCDVLQADGGTRTNAISGAYIALYDCIDQMLKSGELAESPLRHQVAATSVGIVNDQIMLDLSYEEDAAAAVDMNVVMDEQLSIIEIQGTAEGRAFSRAELDRLYELAENGIGVLLARQRQAVEEDDY